MDAKTKWIWKQGQNGENTWMDIVKKFTLEGEPEKAVAYIAADSKYWLYINGKAAVFEGGVKRGSSKHSTYYDAVDIARYLREGENTIAALVWHFGQHGFSHLSSGMGGFLFEADIDGMTVSSDSSWKIMKDPAFVEADENDLKANFRLPESNIYYDASKALGEWYMPDFDTSGWDNADIVGDAGKGAWGELRERIIPQFRDYGMKDYINSADYEGFIAEEDTVIELRLPYNAQITPYLKVTAPTGKRIDIKADNYNDSLYNTNSVMAVYYTKEGLQEYESLGWINGEVIYYTIPAGVTVHSLRYRETGYDTEFAASFECDDEFLNRLWQKSLRTLYITMRDNFMDCPDRERAQWWGDVNVEMQMMMYALDEKALLLYKKGVDAMAGWAEDSGYMLTVVPSGKDQFELPMQNLAGIWGFWYYYEYTGDRTVPERAYKMSRDYLMSFGMKDGLVEHKKGSWDWPDWGDNADTVPMENAWYYMALTSCRRMAELLGYPDDIALFDKRLESIRADYDRAFWKDGYYYSSTENGAPDDRANALAVLSGLADKNKYEDIRKILLSTENASPYMEKYVLDALCEMGYTDEACGRMKKRYKEMVGYDYSTLWEYWSKEGTLNHAWSGGPLITMSKYIAGIRPLDTAYKTFEIKPEIDRLNYIKCRVPSVKGVISLEIEKNDGSINMRVEIPENTTAEVYKPEINGTYKEYTLSSGVYSL